LVETIGVIENKIAQRVETILNGVNHKPEVVVAPNWYY
jgi:hypothetical protein